MLWGAVLHIQMITRASRLILHLIHFTKTKKVVTSKNCLGSGNEALIGLGRCEKAALLLGKVDTNSLSHESTAKKTILLRSRGWMTG